MPVDTEALFRGEAFASLGEERLLLFRRFADDIQGKSAPEIVALYMKLNGAINKTRPLSEAERAAIIAAISSSLPDADRKTFERFAAMLNMKR